jgi:hypothetical protein
MSLSSLMSLKFFRNKWNELDKLGRLDELDKKFLQLGDNLISRQNIACLLISGINTDTK